MSEDRTQPPSKHRRSLAREQGQAAHSPELTAAAGWLAAVVALGFYGDDLGRAMIGLVRGSMEGTMATAMPADPAGVSARARGLVLALGWPLGAILAAFAVAAVAAHQAQVKGLWAPRLIAPDPARLWGPGSGPGLAVRSVNAAWAIGKAMVVAIVAVGMLRAGWGGIVGLSALEPLELARASGRSVLSLAGALAGVLGALGLADYALRHFRHETMLRTTSWEQREDQRVIEGDPAARAQRRRIVQAWRADSSDRLAGASLMLTGPGGLTVVLSGGPPPRRATVRAAADGAAGQRLRRSGEAAKLPWVEAGDLARGLTRHSLARPAVPADRLAELAAVWPAPPAP